MRLVKDPSLVIIVIIPWAPAVILSKLAFLSRPGTENEKPDQKTDKKIDNKKTDKKIDNKKADKK